ncbi:hypothetical protein ACFLS1_11870 [Verrucomicrobiota bacterium]
MNLIKQNKLKQSLLRLCVSTMLFVAGVSYIPYLWCSRNADTWYNGDLDLQKKLARGVEKWVTEELAKKDFCTGSKQFDGEWLFGSYMMAGMGFGQTALEHPELREKHIELMSICIERMLSSEVRAFDKDAWGNDPIETLDSDTQHHAAYLGYLNLVLSMHRLLKPDSEYAELNDRITEALVKRVNNSRILLIQSYPYETYPVDNCCVIGSIGLHSRATGIDRKEILQKWATYCREKYIDPKTGLFYQCVDSVTGEPIDHPRGSGTALGLYALSFANMDLSQELYEAAKKHLAGTVFGFGGVREYPIHIKGESGDIDSGPIVSGYGLSATGFLISGARIHNDREYYKRLYSTAYACGAPFEKKGKLNFVTGGSLGDAILFAMLTAGGEK